MAQLSRKRKPTTMSGDDGERPEVVGVVKTKPVSSLGWVVVALGTSVLLVAPAVIGVWQPGGSEAAYTILLLGWPVVGALVVWRRPGNRIGMAMIVYATWFAIAASAEAYVVADNYSGASLASDLAAWLSAWAFPGTLPALGFIAATFPSGRFGASWVRWTFVLFTLTTAFVMLSRMFLPITPSDPPGLANPWARTELAGLVPVVDTVANLALGLLVLLIVDLVRRWVRSTGVERLQMRWIGWTLLLFVVALVVTTLMRVAGMSEGVMAVADTIAWLSFISVLPWSIGIAVTRYRLYEIDRVISRTVTYIVVLIVLGALYGAGIFLLRELLPFEGSLPVAASTLVVAAVFNPLRRRVQTWVERRFNRSHYDAQRVAFEFAGSLRDVVDQGEVVEGWVGVVAETMQPAAVGVWLRRGGG